MSLEVDGDLMSFVVVVDCGSGELPSTCCFPHSDGLLFLLKDLLGDILVIKAYQ